MYSLLQVFISRSGLMNVKHNEKKLYFKKKTNEVHQFIILQVFIYRASSMIMS